MLDEEVIHKEFENIKLNVNFKLFSVAIKNLIDNAIKHSDDGKVTIKTEQQCIVFENTGNSLEHELDSYFEPFFANNNTNSFGLGLYIVNSILKANGYFLEYAYENKLNRFIVKPNENHNGI
jgi:two-component system OmpR family sensor kinase